LIAVLYGSKKRAKSPFGFPSDSTMSSFAEFIHHACIVEFSIKVL